jgi:L-seryl-tRNA(Ser) seleniumtransferase
VHKLLSTDVAVLKRRATKLARALSGFPADVSVVGSNAQVGGGTLPRSEVDSIALAVKPTDISARELANRLRSCDLPVIGTVANGRVQLDLRAVFPDQDRLILDSLKTVLADA